jgi:Mlc titration factor MtfA (ptsG expression regulator)
VIKWWRRRRRRTWSSLPFPDSWREIVRRNAPRTARLPADLLRRLEGIANVLVREKYWEGCRGQVIDDEVRVTIAIQAAQLVAGFEDSYFDRVPTVLVYPDEFVVRGQHATPGGWVGEFDSIRLGEAWSSGPVILSWADVLEDAALPGTGRNVVLHEFAHALDMEDESFDGTPLLEDAATCRTWAEVMGRAYDRHVRSVERGRATLLDEYGAESESEFFAVATECFFERPVSLWTRHRPLYDVLAAFYRQDPARRA